jgi:calcineurin-like phosphoesterase family protein
MTTFFTADLHLDHENILKITDRPFTSVLDHDEHVLENINRLVGRTDRLFVLGDVAWHSIGNHIDRIVCKDIHLVWGNHDRANFGKKFKTAEDVAEIKIGAKPNEHKVWLSHYAHAYWPCSHRGSFHLYGHTHRQREETLDTLFPGRRSMDVGVDNARHLLGEMRPFSEHEIIEILGSRPGHDQIEFYDQFQAKLRQPKHVCGLAGYDGMRDPPCPACEKQWMPK